MSTIATHQQYSLGEEIASSVIHGIGLLLAIAGMIVLVVSAASHDAWHVVGVSVFGLTLIILFTASTLYHSIPHPRVKGVFRVLDHSAIFLLIAGTYTPFTLVNLRGGTGWWLFGVIWTSAIIGIALRSTLRTSSTAVYVPLYILMGWAAVFAIRPMLLQVGKNGMLLLLVGGIMYTGGVIFYAWRKLPYNHAIWHGFVLAASIFHYFAVLLYVVPYAN